VGGIRDVAGRSSSEHTAIGSGQNFVQTAVDSPSSAAPGRTIASQESLDSSPTAPKDTVTLSGLVSPLSKNPEAQVAAQDLSSSGSVNKNIASSSPARKPDSSIPSQGFHSSAQQSLQQLDESLQRMGIDPQRISLIRRVEALNLADDPLALEQYFRSSASPVPQANQQTPGSSSYVGSNQSTKPTDQAADGDKQDFTPTAGFLLNISS
jgi:hypothetical protein